MEVHFGKISAKNEDLAGERDGSRCLKEDGSFGENASFPVTADERNLLTGSGAHGEEAAVSGTDLQVEGGCELNFIKVGTAPILCQVADLITRGDVFGIDHLHDELEGHTIGAIDSGSEEGDEVPKPFGRPSEARICRHVNHEVMVETVGVWEREPCTGHMRVPPVVSQQKRDYL